MTPENAALVQAKLLQGLTLHQQGRLAEAERLYEEALRQAPDNFAVLHLLGVIALQTGRAQRGVDLIAQAIKLNPNIAGIHSNLGNGLKDLGRFSEALASFDKAIALQPDYAEAYNNRGIVLQDLKRLDEALASFDKAIALNPNYAEAYNNRGVALHQRERLADALASFDKAIALNPNYAEAYSNRGNMLKDLSRLDEALASCDRAIALNPNYATAYYNRGIVLQDMMRFDDALASFGRAIALRPHYPEAYNNRGAVLQELKRVDEAVAAFEKAIELKPDFAEAYNNLSLCLLLMGRFDQGWRLYEWRKKLEDPFGNRFFSKPAWLRNEDISSKTLFLHWEQGLGDTIQFCRYGKLLKARGINVVMSVQQPLHRLLQQMASDVTIINENEVPAEFDYHCPLMSLPLAFGTTLQTIPSEQRYLVADRQLSSTWQGRLPPPTKPRVGIAWSGNTKHKNDRNRSIDLRTFAPLLSVDAHWISLQKEIRQGDAAVLGETRQLFHFGEALTDFADTAALIDHLDLVITIDTSVAHLAGAMGKPVWILLPYNCDGRWLLDRDDSPWYPSVRLFRQDSARSWPKVIAAVQTALHDRIQNRRGGGG